jgi:glycosyltransferase involved in cell wall biosynthesis
MHIGINAQLLSFSQNYRNGGMSRYIRYLLKELARRPGNHEYTVFVNGEEVIEHLAAQHPQITYVAAPWPESQPVTRVVWEQFALPSLIRQKHIDVLHSPVNVLPERVPQNCTTVVTLHDLAFLRFPEVLTRAKRLYHRAFTLRSLQRASMIITVSNSTKQDAHELIGIPTERMRTVYTCIDERFLNVMEMEKVQAFRQQKGLGDGFLLYLGTLEPRKNLTTLIDAYVRLRQVYGVREKLVLAGSKGWLYDAIFEKVRQHSLESEVVFPGYVADDEQVLWYSAASTFVYPSLYEGFGMPVVEALACGIPVVTSNVSSLPEAGATLALTVNPDDSNALAEALHQSLTDFAYRERCRASVPLVKQQFSAQSMAEQTIAVYEQAAALQGRSQRHFDRLIV